MNKLERLLADFEATVIAYDFFRGEAPSPAKRAVRAAYQTSKAAVLLEFASLRATAAQEPPWGWVKPVTEEALKPRV